MQMSFSIKRTRLILFSVLLFVFVGFFACSGEKSDSVRNAALEPRLIHDQAEMDVYLQKFPFQDYEICEVPEIGKFYLDDNPAAVKKTLRKGRPWEKYVIEEFKRYVVPGTTVLDVGAHIGSHTIPLARLVGPQGHVYAFEPQKKIFRELVYNLELNEINNVTPLRFAISSGLSIVEMDAVKGPDGQVAIGKGGDKVEARTLDSFGFSNISLIKIDVEGHQAFVLEGAERTIREWHPVIIIEITEAHKYNELPPYKKKRIDETKRLLKAFGYYFRLIRPNRGHDYIALYEKSAQSQQMVR
jgi:FkbM family methyltransferase